MPEASRLMHLYLLLDEERLEWDAREDAGSWPRQCESMQDTIRLFLSDAEIAELNARGV